MSTRAWWNAIGVALAAAGVIIVLTAMGACATLVWQESKDDTEKISERTAAIGTGDVVETDPVDEALLELLREIDERLAALEGALDLGGSDPVEPE